MNSQPNIIICTADQLASYAIGCHGNGPMAEYARCASELAAA